MGSPRDRESGWREAAAAAVDIRLAADRAEETEVWVGVVLLADWPFVLEPAEEVEVDCSSDGKLDSKDAAVETADAMLVPETV